MLDSHNPEDRPDFAAAQSQGGMQGNVHINMHGGDSDGVLRIEAPASAGVTGSVAIPDVEKIDSDDLADSMKNMAEQMRMVTEQISQLRETTDALNHVSAVLLNSYRSITDNSESVSASSAGYVERLEDLNRNIGGLNTIYEIQLKSISSQLESIDRVNRGLKDIRDMYEKSANESSRYCEETERMSRYMRQLNKIYENMITAMTVNMANPMMGSRQNPFDDGSRDSSNN